MKKVKLYNENNLEALKKLPENSIDSIVTDPPYGLSFMNKKWDYEVPSVEFWKEIYRVLKPGGHVLSFGGTRTYHRMVVNMEDAGFEIRDQIMWIYGSGFPKSLNVGKAVDKLNGVEREQEEYIAPDGKKRTGVLTGDEYYKSEGDTYNNEIRYKSKGSSEYEGWGTALKPANEPICLARKPLSEKSVAENVLKYKTGGLNIDGCRIGTDDKLSIHKGKFGFTEGTGSINENSFVSQGQDLGRFPANIILECCCDEVIQGEKGECGKKIQKGDRKYGENNFTNGGMLVKDGWETNTYSDKGDIHTNPECPCYIMDQQSGVSKTNHKGNRSDKGVSTGLIGFSRGTEIARQDSGGASRFFYQAKVSKAERNMGLDGFEEKKKETKFGTIGNRKEEDVISKNNHPTVKPINLLTYLCRLVTPPNGIVLDPFMGSGSTGIAAQLEGFRFVGMELETEYFNIAEARIENWEKYKKFIK